MTHQYPTAEQMEEMVRERAAYRRGLRDAMHDVVPNVLPGTGEMHPAYERGVEEGNKRKAMTPDERLKIIMDYYGCVDPAAKADIPRQVALGNRFITITRDDDDDDYYIASYETLDDVWDGLADEIYGERVWWPHAIFDLHTGETIPCSVQIKVTRGKDDAALTDELTSEGIV